MALAKEDGMSIIVKNMAIVLIVPITIFGLYVIAHGHLTPGGGFPGGAILASLVALFLVAFGAKAVKAMQKGLFSTAESLGLLAFVALALLGIGETFFKNSLANSIGLFGMGIGFGSNPGFIQTGGVIPLMNFAVGLEVFAALSIIVILFYSLEGGKAK